MKTPDTLNAESQPTPETLSSIVKSMASSLGLSHCGITDVRLDEHEAHLLNWLKAGFHGEMEYMHRHGTMRSRPAELLPGTIKIVSVRLDYQPPEATPSEAILADSQAAFISRYALGRDYHKVLRKKLQKLAEQMTSQFGSFGYRAFVDSAPVLEKAIAEKAGLGWIGKHSNLLTRDGGSWFFLGELFTDLPLACDSAHTQKHCGSCTACIQSCPTNAIVAPYKVDARRCISYHTIELKGSIPVEFRKPMGNRIYGCDDCQLVCPFNKFSKPTTEPDFAIRHQLDRESLLNLFSWDEETFKRNMSGSAIHRIGHERWIRNIAVALGNAETSEAVIRGLSQRENDPSALIREHVLWALGQHAH